jgi:hypothetical protein
MTIPIVTRLRATRATRGGPGNGSASRPAGLRPPPDQGLHTLRMDRNAYRDDNRTDQPGSLADQPRSLAEQPRTPGDQRDTYPEQRETYPDEPDTYWRRRAVTLAGGLVVLGLLAWALSGGGGKPGATAAQNSPASGPLSAPASPGASASFQASAAASATSSAGTASGADAAVPGLASQGTSGLPSASQSSTAGARRKAAAAGAGAKSAAKSTAKSTASAAQAAAPTEPGGRCASSAVVLSLVSGDRSYTAGQNPAFGVDAVSTAPGSCTFDLGPRQLHLVVMSAGRVIWDSADCARGDGTQSTRLTRGVPVQESFTWNRAITLPGCVTLASSARSGSYEAQARTGSITSGVYTFRLVR